MAGHDRFQLLLVPKSLDDSVDPENPVRFIEAFVDGLGMSLPATSNEMPGFDASQDTRSAIEAYFQRKTTGGHTPAVCKVVSRPDSSAAQATGHSSRSGLVFPAVELRRSCSVRLCVKSGRFVTSGPVFKDLSFESPSVLHHIRGIPPGAIYLICGLDPPFSPEESRRGGSRLDPQPGQAGTIVYTRKTAQSAA
ncbi:MAG TPA: hypothetical protein VHT68_08775, partial [Pseudolabrys sp.]|nr:hypothetical protein [Pseudolabrys sp.]